MALNGSCVGRRIHILRLIHKKQTNAIQVLALAVYCVALCDVLYRKIQCRHATNIFYTEACQIIMALFLRVYTIVFNIPHPLTFTLKKTELGFH